MQTFITRLATIVLILAASMQVAQAKRVLLPPPDGYKGVEVNGIKLVVGQVYVPEFADTTRLKAFGFRAFEAMGSTHNYKKVKAVWPLDTDLHALPEWIIGLTYEKARNVEEIQRAYTNSPGDPQLGGFNVENYGSFFYNSGYYNSTTNNYYSPSGSYNPGWCSWENDYSPEAYRYRTTTRTNLKPTEIGSYPDNKFLKRKCSCGVWGCTRHSGGRSFR